MDKKTRRIFLRAKLDYIEFNEKNTKYFSALEKKHAEKKSINRLTINGNIITDQKTILNETRQFYKNLYKKTKHYVFIA